MVQRGLRRKSVHLVIPHTFGGGLNFNAHLHILVSAGGLRERDGRWLPNVSVNKTALMRLWRNYVINFLRAALKKRRLRSSATPDKLDQILDVQGERTWIIKINRAVSRDHFLRYAGRYVRRPPIAQYRFLAVTPDVIRFWIKDKRTKQRKVTQLRPDDFIRALADHLPDHYQHAIRYFGLLAPRKKARTSSAVLALLRQTKRPRPVHLSWALSIKKGQLHT